MQGETILKSYSPVKKVGEMVSIQDTLTIVTADHSHAFGMVGYPSRGKNILGKTLFIFRVVSLVNKSGAVICVQIC